MRYIKLSKNTRATICDCHYKLVSKYKWYNHRGYAATNIDGKYKSMHSLVANTPLGYETDHVNRKIRDNRCSNLRIVTTSENQANRPKSIKSTSGYKGVYWRADRNKYQSRIEVNRVKINLGHFKTKQEAALAYDIAAIQLFGRIAYTNIL